jgi:hypothetical protein
MKASSRISGLLVLLLLALIWLWTLGSDSVLSPPSPKKPQTQIRAHTHQSCLVYTNLGEDFRFQSYIWDSILQARRFNPDGRIVVITSRQAIQSVESDTKVQSLNVEFVEYDNIIASDPLTEEFEKVFFVQGEMAPEGNNNFVQFTSKRLFVLHAWMKASQAGQSYSEVAFNNPAWTRKCDSYRK